MQLRTLAHALLYFAILPFSMQVTANAAVATDDFNSGSTQPGFWSAISLGSVRGAGEPGFNGSHALWFGGSGSRYATTKSFNTSFGATIKYRFRAGDDTSAIWEACEPPEAIVLDISPDGGTTWYGLRYHSAWYIQNYRYWGLHEVKVPAVYQSADTRFRFRQASHSGAGWDHWAIDDVEVTTEDPVGTSWSQTLGENFTIQKCRCDSSGTVQLLIKATGDFTLGSFTGSTGTYLASASANGSWTKLTELTGSSYGFTVYDMDTDASGNVYLSGAYSGITPLNLPAAWSSGNGFVAKLSSAHVLQWSNPVWGAEFRSLGLDSSGNVVLTGSYSATTRFGPSGHLGEPELSGDPGSYFLARYNSSGTYQWAIRIGEDQSTDPQFVAGVRCDSSGNAYVWGRFYSTLSISPLSDLTTPGGYSGTQFGFLLKYNASGAAQWSTSMGSSSEARDVAIHGSDIYVSGYYGYGGNPFTPTGSATPEVGDADSNADDWFLLKLASSNGAASWVRTAGSVAGANGFTQAPLSESVRVDTSGNIYTVYSIYEDNLLNGTATIEAFPGFDKVLAKWTSTGDLVWHKRATFYTASIDLDPIGQTYAGGLCSGLGVFESNASLDKPFLHKFNNIFESTSPVAVTIERDSIPSNWLGGRNLGLLRTVDSDADGSYTLELVEGDGDTHNSFFTIDSSNHLVLAEGARLAQGDSLTCRVRVTDEMDIEAESNIEFSVIEPDSDQWVHQFSMESGNVRASASGPDGSFFIGGEFYGTLTAGDFTATSLGSGYDWFIVKFDATGTPLWISHGGADSNDYLRAITVGDDGTAHAALQITKASGNISVMFNGSLSAQLGGTGTSNGLYKELAVISLKESGNMKWFNICGGNGDEWPQGIAYDDASGRVAVTGYFSGADFNTSGYTLRSINGGPVSGSTSGPTLNNPTDQWSDHEIFVASFDSTGDLEWAKSAGSSLTSYSADKGKGVAFDSSGNLAVAGEFSGYATFSGTSKSSGGTGTLYPNSDIFLWKLDSSGLPLWLRTGGSSSRDDQGRAVGIDSSGNIYMVGRIFGNAFAGDSSTFGSVSFVPTDSFDVILVKYNTSGTALTGHLFGDNTSANYSTSNEFTGLKVWPSGEVSIGVGCTRVDSTNILDGSNQPTGGYQHYFTSDGTREWSGTSYFGEYTSFAPDLAPLLYRKVYANEEIAGIILDAGPTTARVTGPDPVRSAPTGISLSSAGNVSALSISYFQTAEGVPSQPSQINAIVSVDENQPADTIVANISAADTDSSSFTYQLIGGEGSDGNPAFAISGTQLVTTAPLNYEEISSYSVRLRVIDESGLTYEEAFTIHVNDLPDTQTPVFSFSDTSHTADGQPHGVTVSVEPYGIPYTLTYNGSSSEPNAAGPYDVVAVPDHPDYAGNGTSVMWIRDAYLQWIANQLDSSIAYDPDQESDGWGALADPDKDGLSNKLEFYFGTQAGDVDGALATITPKSIIGGTEFEWLRNPSGPSAQVKWSPNLLDWYTSGNGPSGDARTILLENLGSESGRERIKATLSDGIGSTGFIQIVVP